MCYALRVVISLWVVLFSAGCCNCDSVCRSRISRYRFVFLEVVGMCSVHAVRRAVYCLSNKKSALTLTYILFVRVVARFHAEHPTHLGSICIDLRFAIGRVRCHT